MSSHFQDTAAPLSLGPLFHCCLPVSLNISFQTSILSEFLAQPCSCLVCDNSGPYAMQEQHSRSSLCRQRLTSSKSHHCPGSVSSAHRGALQLDAVPHTASSVLQSCLPLRHLLMLHLRIHFFWICLQIHQLMSYTYFSY